MPYAIKKGNGGTEQVLCVNIMGLGYYSFGTMKNLQDLLKTWENSLATVKLFDSTDQAAEFITANPFMFNARNNIVCKATVNPNGYSFIPVIEEKS